LIKNPKHIKGKFIGIYESKNANAIGMFTISKIHWTYLKIENLELLSHFDFEAAKTGDYWFSKKIIQKTSFNYYRKTTEIFVPNGETAYFSDDLHNVIIKNIKFNKDASSYKSHSFIEVTGDIYFQVETKLKAVEPPIENNVEPMIDSTATGVNVDESGLHLVDNGIDIPIGIPSVPIKNPSIDYSTSSTSNFGWLWNILGIIFWLLILMYCWKTAHQFFYIFLVVAIGWLITRFLGKSGLGKIFSFLFIFILFIYGLTFLSNKSKNLLPVETEEGKIKISPPIKTEQQEGSNNKDFSTEKEVQWFDFIKNKYLAKYSTSSLLFFESQKNVAELNRKVNSSNVISYFNGLYEGMEKNDNPKIKKIVKQFAEKAQQKNLNQLETAEMVTTFVQEIPYCLVHDYTCQQVIENSNSSFVASYHRDGKPCLPNIPGGVQSPYEFLHNLKGDCDTRSLLAFAILKELQISASIWVSETYAHSILGIGLPIAGGAYKTIDGVRHYGVELTAKGYRVGMVNPQHYNMSNWDIALYYHQH
jgi:Na+-transporting methylmalonyl-CoA/oxaloacetate decarboxylase gamma subunit